jgi:hypothetical protein
MFMAILRQQPGDITTVSRLPSATASRVPRDVGAKRRDLDVARRIARKYSEGPWNFRRC